MYKFTSSTLDLEKIAVSGQTFRFKKLDNGSFLIPSNDKALIISQNGANFTALCSEEEFNSYWHEYFDLDTDYAAIEGLILASDDSYLKGCLKNGHGVRILHQDLWEMIVTFMISQNNNIKRITKSVELLCERLGTLKTVASDCTNASENFSYYTFPSPDAAYDGFFDDASLGLGYRAPYLDGIFKHVSTNPDWLDKLSSLDYDEAMSELLKIKGIGKKVANCICLFGLHMVDAFPIDTHIKQILAAHYPAGFDFERYKGVAGIVQQYMFYDKIN